MAYRIPTDLPLIAATVMDWPAEARIRAVMATRPQALFRAKIAAVAITLNEQPGKVYAGNCCGIMCQGLTFPWGWRGIEWNSRPVGYALLREGATGVRAPFLAFACVEDSLGFLIDRVTARSMYQADDYALSWVGARPGTQTYSEAMRGFDAAYDRAVAALWQIAAASRGD